MIGPSASVSPCWESLLAERLAVEFVAGTQAAHECTVAILLNYTVQRPDAKRAESRSAAVCAKGAKRTVQLGRLPPCSGRVLIRTTRGGDTSSTTWSRGDYCGGTPVRAVSTLGGGRMRLHHWARILGIGRQGLESVGQYQPFNWLG